MSSRNSIREPGTVVDAPSLSDETECDHYTTTQHVEMDQKVLEILDDVIGTPLPVNPSRIDLAAVFSMVARGDPKMSASLRLPDPYFLRENPDVENKMRDAWKDKTFRRIRVLVRLQVPRRNNNLDALQAAMTQEYKGTAVDAFLEYLQKNERMFHSGKDKYYAKFCSITQSSGTGKTRLLLELGKRDICVLYMNIQPHNDLSAHPPRDPIPAEILSEYCPTEGEYCTRCRIFFVAIFKCLATFLKRGSHLVLSDINNEARTSFFKLVQKEFANIEREMRSTSWSEVMLKYFKKMINSLRLRDFKNSPKVVIALDEAHELYEGRPSKRYIRAMVLFQTIREWSTFEGAVWVVLTSTAPKIARYPIPLGLSTDPEGDLLFPPFTQLGWDQHSPALADVDLEHVAWGSHLIQYGRPLWWSLRHRSIEYILELAGEKLRASRTFNPRRNDQVFAVLGQRLGLGITFGHHRAVRENDTLVTNQLRVCIETTEDRIWSYTTYPSEPILSAVAAEWLHKDDENVAYALATLLSMADEGLINIGESEELASRVLWLLARDFCVREGKVIKYGSDELLYCRAVPVTAFLELVFGAYIWDDAPNARDAFQDAYVNFSHWVQMGANITQEDASVNDVPIEEWTKSFWVRTSAIQCCCDQPVIDKVIPIYFKYPSHRGTSRMSHIFISDKARDSAQYVPLDAISRSHKNIASDYDGPPYIVIRADLDLPHSDLIVHDLEERTTDPCLRIYASGLNEKTFPFLPEDIACILHDLGGWSPAPSEPSLLEALKAQMQFGWSREARYMDCKK